MSHEPSVIVIGGGYGGINVAKALDDVARVTLVEPRDAFHHNVAALRALVDPQWTARTFYPYEHLLGRGTVLRDRAVAVDQYGARLASGTRLTADYLVLATGSTYPFPAKSPVDDSGEAVARYHALRRDLEQARRVLLLGAGAVGLELAGEIAAAWPRKQITLVDVATTVLPGPYDPRLREEIDRQLDSLRVARVLGSALTTPPGTEPGELKDVSVRTAAGATVEADIWFRCYGVTPVTGYLAGDLAAARTPEGLVTVTPELSLPGFPHVYAIGDIADADVKKSMVAGRQAAVAAANIRASIDGTTGRQRYVALPPSIILPLGPTGGAGQRSDTGEIISAQAVSQIKGADLFLERYITMFGLARPGPAAG